jgi:hypothetical protein
MPSLLMHQGPGDIHRTAPELRLRSITVVRKGTPALLPAVLGDAPPGCAWRPGGNRSKLERYRHRRLPAGVARATHQQGDAYQHHAAPAIGGHGRGIQPAVRRAVVIAVDGVAHCMASTPRATASEVQLPFLPW